MGWTEETTEATGKPTGEDANIHDNIRDSVLVRGDGDDGDDGDMEYHALMTEPTIMDRHRIDSYKIREERRTALKTGGTAPRIMGRHRIDSYKIREERRTALKTLFGETAPRMSVRIRNMNAGRTLTQVHQPSCRKSRRHT